MVKSKDAAPRIIDSDRSGPFRKDGHTVEVFIYKLENIDGWTLEIVDAHNTSTLWDDEFETDEDAWLAFMKMIEEKGIESVVARVETKNVH